MKKPNTLVAIILSLAINSAAHAWQVFLDGSAFPDFPWEPFSNEGTTTIVDLGEANFALRLDSPDHSLESPPPGTYYNEYFVTDIPGYEKLGAARFRLDSFTPTGAENLLSVSTPVAAPTITLVDGDFWLWSYLSEEPNQPILNLGPAVAGEFHEVYILATVTATDDMDVPIAGGAKVWWDGDVVYDGPVDGGGDVNVGGYVEFGSGTFWQVNAGTVVDFDWVRFGDVNDFPVPPDTNGDFNEDGSVDTADYVVWRKHDETQQEYDNWRTNFGRTASAHDASSGTKAAIPEPRTIPLLTLALAPFFCGIGRARAGHRRI
jgi:hypothetical protein